MSQVDDVVKTFEGLKCREDEATNHHHWCHNLYCHYCHIKIAIIFQGTLGQHCQGSGSQCPCQRWTFELPPSFVIIIIINAKHPYFVPICGEPTQKSLMIFLGSNLACCSGPFNKNIVAMTTKINHQPWAGPSGIRNFNLGWDFFKIRGSWDFLGRDWFNIFILNCVGTNALKSLSCLIW